MSARILVGDCLQRMGDLSDASVDSVVCDPPYHLTSIVKRFGKSAESHLAVKATKDQSTIKAAQYGRLSKGFMGQTWDGGDVAFREETWAEVLRVLKPGGHLVAFSGTRTYHRMVVAIEDAGFEIRDQLAWVYGSGFPKSHNLGDGWGTALKPAWEPIALARKPLVGTNLANMAEHGVGGLNVDGCRIGDEERLNLSASSNQIYGQFKGAETEGRATIGRWPANIIHDGSDEVVAGFPESDGAASPVGPQYGAKTSVNAYGDWGPRQEMLPRGDSGSAARFFAQCQYGDDEWEFLRNGLAARSAESLCGSCGTPIAGDPAATLTLGSSGGESRVGQASIGICESCTLSLSRAHIAANQGSIATIPIIPSCSRSNGSATLVTDSTTKADGKAKAADANVPELATRFLYCPKATTEERGEGNNHPTVKPVALMRWLARLVTPKGGTVLDPFMGSGSTALACDAEQFNFIGCELSPQYAEIARNRIAATAGMFADISVEHSPATEAA